MLVDGLKRSLVPVVVVLGVLVGWSFFVGPGIAEFRADLAFLRAARIQVIQQQMKAQAPPEAAPAASGK
jgi:hypothetical protein